jgi:hypothetical protein
MEKSKLTETGKGETGDINTFFTNNSSWQAKQSLMFQSDCLKMWEDFAPNFGDKITGCCTKLNAPFFATVSDQK